MSATPTSSASTPQHASTTPQPQAHSPAPNGSSASKALKGRPKPTNVFSNDGSFLERFQRSKKEEEDKKKAEEDIARKRGFDERFKQRRKRPVPDASVPNLTADDPPSKKLKGEKDQPLTQYQKEVKSYTASLKDDGMGVRPLVK